jgi:hypothetical protein
MFEGLGFFSDGPAGSVQHGNFQLKSAVAYLEPARPQVNRYTQSFRQRLQSHFQMSSDVCHCGSVQLSDDSFHLLVPLKKVVIFFVSLALRTLRISANGIGS